MSSSDTDLNKTLGAAFIGLIFAAILFGVTNVQSFIYYQNSARDPKYVRWMILVLWLLDTLQLALISTIVYVYLVIDFTNINAITKFSWLLPLVTMVTSISNNLVRLFYARRIWIMSEHNWFITSGVLIFVSFDFFFGLGSTTKLFNDSTLTELDKLAWMIYVLFITMVVADAWVSASLCFFLQKHRTGFKATDSIINVLIVYVISTGLLTCISSVCILITYAAMPRSYIFIGIYFSAPKLQFNALLAMLNARKHIREGQTAGPHLEVCSYQMNQSLNAGMRNDTSFEAINAAKKDEFRLGGRELVVSVQTETSHHADVVRTDSRSEGNSSVLHIV